MKKFKSLFVVMGVCAAFGLVGCDDGGEDTTPTPTPDVTTGTDAATTSDTAGGKDATTAGTDAATAGTDAKVEPDVPPAKTCDPGCTAAQFCDLTVDPPKCKDATCALPTTFGPTIQKVSVVKLLATTEGCDLDDDGKVNNVVGKVVSLYKEVNTLLAEQIADGTVSIIFESKEWKTDGTSFAVSGIIGDVDPTNADCDVISDSANCKYTANPSSYNKSAASGTCPALIGFSDAKVSGGKMTAGGDDATFALSIPITGIVLDLKISKAQISADVTDGTAWKSSKNGKICGVIAKTDLEAAINALPEDVLAQIGGKAQALTLINSLLAPDIDLDDDGKKDAISVGIGFESVPGQVTGISAAK
jgi:hypothetical protein